MAYAAGIGDTGAVYMDTSRPGGIVGHPLFPVCVEWDAYIREGRRLLVGLTPDEVVRGVHATHDALLHEPVRPGMHLETRVTVTSIEQRAPGAYVVTRYDTTAAGEPVTTTWQGSILRGVDVVGPDCALDDDDRPATVPADWGMGTVQDTFVEVAAGAAHVYSECARIWNPIHTDAAVAAKAALPSIILHGTATLAMAISRVLHDGELRPEHVGRISARFAAMVAVPSSILVRTAPGAHGTTFVVRTPDGDAIRDGLVATRPCTPT